MTPSTEILRRHRPDIERSVCSESFADFFVRAWPHMEPTRALLPSVAIDAMCAAGQAVADGRIRRLAVSTCPGTSKSLLWAVAFPAWLLLRSAGTARIMVGSYSWMFATRDSSRCRDLVQSEWYRELVAGTWVVRVDANHKDDWSTSTTGRRLITSVEGKSTGERCTFQVIDDALSASSIYSSPAKAEAIRWVNEVLTSRLEDQRTDPRVMVGQGLCVGDPIDEAIKRGWSYMALPAVLGEDEQGCALVDDAGVEVWRDPRAPGEPLVELLDLEALDRLRDDLGSTAFAAQYLQRRTDDSVSPVKRVWWRFWRPDHVSVDARRPAGCDESVEAVDLPMHFDRVVITADLTFGSTDGDWAVCQAWASSSSGRYLLDQWRKRAGFEESLLAIEAMARKFPGARVAIEKAANGAAVIEQIKKRIPGVVALRPLGKKAQRLGAAIPTIESGCCFLPLGAPWIGEFVEELSQATKHDDMLDCCAYAVIDLNSKPALVSHGGYGG